MISVDILIIIHEIMEVRVCTCVLEMHIPSGGFHTIHITILFKFVPWLLLVLLPTRHNSLSYSE